MRWFTLTLVILILLADQLFAEMVINPERTIKIWEKITPQTAQRVVWQLRRIDSQQSAEPIFIQVFSEGGDMDATLAICQTMKDASHDIVTIGEVFCYSGGAIILSSGTKGKRYLLRNTKVMIHANRLISASCCLVPGISSPVNKIYTWLVKTLGFSSVVAAKGRKKVFDVLADNTGKTEKEIAQDCKTEQWFFAEDAIAYGLADHLVDSLITKGD